MCRYYWHWLTCQDQGLVRKKRAASRTTLITTPSGAAAPARPLPPTFFLPANVPGPRKHNGRLCGKPLCVEQSAHERWLTQLPPTLASRTSIANKSAQRRHSDSTQAREIQRIALTIAKLTRCQADANIEFIIILNACIIVWTAVNSKVQVIMSCPNALSWHAYYLPLELHAWKERAIAPASHLPITLTCACNKRLFLAAL